MQKINKRLGFSLVEVLVSLFVVSLAAVNISGLQKMVGDQNRDNFSHTEVVALVTRKFEQAMQAEQLQDIIDLDGTTSTYTSRAILFKLLWRVKMVSGASTTSPFRELEATITWPDATGAIQTFVYSEQISLSRLLKGVAGSDAKDFSYMIPNLLDTNNVNYFQPKMAYKEDAYVIYDSQLFYATSEHLLSNNQQGSLDPPINIKGIVANGWDRIGRVDNAALATLFIP